MMSSIGFAQSDKVKEAKDDLIMRTPSSADDPLKSITIHQQIDFNASPQQLYEALLDAKQFTEFSGRPAEINREVGGAFSLFKGQSSAATWNSCLIKGSFKPGAWSRGPKARTPS